MEVGFLESDQRRVQSRDYGELLGWSRPTVKLQQSRMERLQVAEIGGQYHAALMDTARRMASVPAKRPFGRLRLVADGIEPVAVKRIGCWWETRAVNRLTALARYRCVL
jgi:hypothetical protein